MAQVVLGAVGQAIGGGFGRAVGAMLGGMLDRAAANALAPARQRGPRLETLRIQGAAEGAPVPCAFGRMRVTGQVIWAARFLEKRRERSGGKGGPRTVEYEYSLSFAVALGEGPIDGIGRVWADGQPFDQAGAAMRVYRGTEDQTPDALIEAIEGETPAYRGLAYVVFEDLPLAAFGNRAPQLSFEVFRRPLGDAPRLEDRLEGVCLIPGAGEFALATEPVARREGLTRTVFENVNNAQGRPDLLVSLDQLEATFPNLKRVSLVVGWFGDDLRAGHCAVRPGVERVDKATTQAWEVAGIGREAAHLISEIGGGPAYGGTPSDESVRQAVAALKARGWAVTLYPFVFIDVPPENGLPDPYGGAEQAAYPWRGRITGEGGAAAAGEVAAIFGEEDGWGLRRMARHYAALAAECGADGLLIGSEMRGLTTLRDAGGGYPAVEALCDLAAECRAIAGPDVALSYAADWSEYFGHQPGDGSGDVAFHLDPLWAHEAIDYVGIDWYPPMGDWRDGAAHLDASAGFAGPSDAAYLAYQVAGGEQFDWFYADGAARAAQARSVISDGAHGEDWLFRPKDLAGWWSHAHHDRPAGVRSATPTAWVPGMKPIRLTEFGCAAVDRGGNAPNLFQDPKSAESALPPFSSGARDDRMQRRLLEAVLTHYEAAENNPVSAVYGGPMLEAMNAWCWDARPFPDFPARAEVWADAGAWNAGHWLNGRSLGVVSDLIAAVLKRAGLDEGDYAVEAVDGEIEGYLIERPMSARDALEPLAAALGLTASERDGRVTIAGRAPAGPALTKDALALPETGASVRRARVLDAPPEAVRVRFIDGAADYQTGAVVVRGEVSGGGEADVDLPMTCAPAQARTAGRRLLSNTGRETVMAAIGPLEALKLEPGDALALEGLDGDWRVTRVELGDAPEAVLEAAADIAAEAIEPSWRTAPPTTPAGAPFVRLLDLPPLPGAESDARSLAAVAAEPWRPMAVHAGGETDSLRLRGRAEGSATVGRLATPLVAGVLHRWDETTALQVVWEGSAPSSAGAAAVLAGANAVAVETAAGWEVLQFREAAPEAGGVWRMRGLLRGRLGTEAAMRAGAAEGAVAVVLNGDLARLDMMAGERGLPLQWRAGPAGAPPGGAAFSGFEASWIGVHDRPWAPARLRLAWEPGGLKVSWLPRARIDGDRWDAEAPQSDPMRFRVRILTGTAVLRSWTVEALETLYAEADRASDVSAGADFLSVAQWSPVFGWGAEATIAL